MPVKSASSARRHSSAKQSVAITKQGVEIIVKRGAMRRFHALKRETSEMPVTILWDRRTNERRGAHVNGKKSVERRGADRRKTPSFTWDLADFVVVTPTKGQKTSRKTSTKKS